MKIKELIHYLESVAPPFYQESYDNSGLLVGNENDTIQQVLLSLDCTEAVVEEAIAKNCQLIISHHPIVFKGLKKLNGNTYVERVIIKAIQHQIAIYAIHTNLDHVIYGVNAKIAEKLGLINCQILAPNQQSIKKLVTFVPHQSLEKLRQALFDAGAGTIGNYSHCSFNTEGSGTFKANDLAKPYVGKLHELHQEAESRLELIYPVHLEKKIMATLIANHPYEEVAYHCIALSNSHQEIGAGMVGYLPEPCAEIDFLKHIQNKMNAKVIRHTPLLGKKIQKIAFCGGSGSFLLNSAINSNSDFYITSDFKYHEFFDAENKIVIADIGHFETEQYTSELLLEIITKKFANFAVRLSETNTNPINYFI